MISKPLSKPSSRNSKIICLFMPKHKVRDWLQDYIAPIVFPFVFCDACISCLVPKGCCTCVMCYTM